MVVGEEEDEEDGCEAFIRCGATLSQRQRLSVGLLAPTPQQVA